jgi:hypothetical protein
MTDRNDEHTSLSEPQQIPNDSDLGEQLPQPADAQEEDEREIRCPAGCLGVRAPVADAQRDR